jgi:hypothetical protein
MNAPIGHAVQIVQHPPATQQTVTALASSRLSLPSSVAKIGLGLINRVAASVQSRYLGIARGTDRARIR